ncbi:response regulator, partial [Xanthomonas sp. Kuri4-1]
MTMMDMQPFVLVVDDDPDLRRLISDFLGEHGYQVEAAENVAEMRRIIAQRRPDLIVLDVMMPGEDGLSAARSLASERGAPAVIMLSALGNDTDRIIGLEVGADDYLAKPCNPRELLA